MRLPIHSLQIALVLLTRCTSVMADAASWADGGLPHFVEAL